MQRSKQSLGLALVGLGHVGRGFCQLLIKQKTALERRLGVELRFLWVCDRHPDKKIKNLRLPSETRVTRNIKPLLGDPRVDIVIELMGGLTQARRLTLEALRSGRHVITANKLMLATCWPELLGAARRNNAHLFFEAAVASGIPIIRSIREGLVASRIHRIEGILNGTTNYILTRMMRDAMPYKEALTQAQRLGFAEADPSLDTSGADTAHKLSILASLASGSWVSPATVYREGIERLNLTDILFAQNRLSLVPRLLGIAEINTGARVSARVHPCLIPITDPMATVDDEYNAIAVSTDAAGTIYFQGKGAGALPAASSVLSDLVDLGQLILSSAQMQLPAQMRPVTALAMRQTRYSYYLRFAAGDRPGVLAKIAGIFGRCGISIAQIYQDALAGLPKEKGRAPIVAVTHPGREDAVQKALASFRSLRRDIDCRSFLRIRG